MTSTYCTPCQSLSRNCKCSDQTQKDPGLLDLMHTVLQEHKANLPPGARPFWNFRDEITYHHGILFKGGRVIVPTSMRPDMLRIIHGSHLGVDKCKHRAQDILYWPGTDLSTLTILVVRLKILSVISRSHYRATKSHYFTKTSQDFKQNLKISLYSHKFFL